MQYLYLVLCLFGAVVPYTQFISFLVANGFDLSLFLSSMFASPISGFAWWDVIISAVVLILFVFAEGRRLQMKNLWIPVVALVVGVSLALPLFLFMRERTLAAAQS